MVKDSEEVNMYYIGIDGGGTKTKFALYNQDLKLLKEVTLPTCHILQVEEEKVIGILKEGIHLLTQNINQNLTLSLGIAGYGQNPTIRHKIESICQNAFHPYPYYLFNDVQTALAGALNNEDGIMVIAGTGSIALAKKGDQQIRCGGWGYSLGDEGSAYYLAKEMLSIFCKQSDGRIEKTYLYEAIKKQCGLKEDHEIIPYIHTQLNNERDKIAHLAVVLMEAAKHNDIYALAIYDKAAKEIALLINTLSNQFDKEVHASFIGGVFKANDYILIPLKKYLKETIQLHAPIYPPEYGAVLLAKKLSTSR